MNKNSAKKRPAKTQKKKPRKDACVLRLYIAGMTPRSSRAIQNIRKVCETLPPDSFDLQVIDIYQQPNLAENEQIIAAPTLIKKLPLPLRRFIGDMTNTERITVGLNLPPAKDKKPQ